MHISLIVAASKNGVIGCNNALPWHLPEEIKYFRKMTTGKPIIMGRKTFESLGNKPLPNRTNIILSRVSQPAEGYYIVSSLEEALRLAHPYPEVMIIGGSQIYAAFLPLAHRIYLTTVHQAYEGDAYLPPINWEEWILINSENHGDFTTQLFERRFITEGNPL